MLDLSIFIKLILKIQDGLLTLDGGERVTGQSRGSLKTLNIGQLTWIGGVDPDSKESAIKRVGTATGFNGCIKDLKLGRNVVSLQVKLCKISLFCYPGLQYYSQHSILSYYIFITLKRRLKRQESSLDVVKLNLLISFHWF